MPKHLHVAAAVVRNDKGEILIARRPATVDQGGLWEFPGGKLAPYETGRQALDRELCEEVGIQVESASPLIRIHHRYPERAVLLDVWQVSAFSGEAYGREGQAVRWVKEEDLSQYSFPEANKPILKALRLPDHYMITGDAENEEQWLQKLHVALNTDIELVQFRAHDLSEEEFVKRANAALELTRKAGALLLLNAEPSILDRVDADGIHLTTERLSHYASRPIPAGKWLSCACHNPTQLQMAQALGADMVTYSPVLATESHPGVEPLGWQEFHNAIEPIPVPVYALGGLGRADIRRARGLGGQGVAGIRAFWPQGAV
ncbi:Nudix family hydrolase [Oceanospirillum linum]|uniref:8-oxo-dGTP diphosphatase n=1 Tax=Oceanospirillum linum TaxID=966 RepID=A0A1T1HF22_OCELI|nr:Nudix family hydrolase [Oceanospirillum linum]OOV88416.1 thiamin phosphate synthase superfamily [Oceanospirillum linum]SEF55508.1 8-oxo-dGTPase [Oleiphilus messinensis]SMP05251.1 8-oxo-dGTP diphosphatase [Oceanospirillum linum]